MQDRRRRPSEARGIQRGRGEERQDVSCIPPSCHVLHRSQPGREVSTLFDLRGATNERQGTGTAEREPPAFLSELLRCCAVW